MAFAIGQCSSQPDEKARLACYDQIATQLKSGTFASVAAPVYQPPGASAPFVQVPTPGSTAMAAAPMAQVPAPQPMVQAPMAHAPAAQNNNGSWYDPTSWFGKDEPQKTSTNPADFGGEALQRTRSAAVPAQEARLEEIRANVTAVAFNPNGRFTVSLANGQIWRQLDGDTGSARFKNKGGDVVTISRGVVGSYNLVVDGRTALFKVKRIQ